MDLMTRLANNDLALPLLRPFASQLLGPRCELAQVEVLHAWRRTWAKPRAENRDFLRLYARLCGIGTDGAAVEKRIQGIVGSAQENPAVRQLPHRIDWGTVGLSFDFLPNDATLTALRGLLSRRSCAYSVPVGARERLGGPPDAVELLSYRPGERAVVRVSRGNQSVFAKLFAGKQHEELAARLPVLQQDLQRRSTNLLLPPMLGHEPADGAVWLGAVAGRAAHDLLADDGTARNTSKRIGAALAQWHQLTPPPALATVTRQQVLIEALRKLRKLRHEDQASSPFIDALERRWPEVVSHAPVTAASLIHGDVHPGQFLLGSGDQVGLCDLDEIALGDVERDLAQSQERLPTDDFLHAWRHHAARDFDANLFRWYLSVAFVDRAYRDLTARGRVALPMQAGRLRQAVECLP